MHAIESVKAELVPLFEQLITHLQNQNQIAESTFFTTLLIKLHGAKEEADLIEQFVELSTTAFLGFSFDPTAALMIDNLLEQAEQVAHTFSVDDDSAH